MGIENITARILQEAKDEAMKTQEAAAAEKAAMLEKAAQEAAKAASDISRKAEEDARILKERRHSVAELEARKMRLAQKQSTIEETFSEALDQMTSMDPDAYLAFLLKQLEPYREEAGIVSLNEKDYDAVGEKLKASLKGTKLTLGEEKAKIRGGFILKQGNVFVNASLEKILETEKKQITAQIAGILFG
ncbi:MAG: V-type ATP synthase subunit E [Oscillospiraceae bacterium]|nr:V-type ATP synthase subunit E [Oscillospiraceae bacterium]